MAKKQISSKVPIKIREARLKRRFTPLNMDESMEKIRTERLPFSPSRLKKVVLSGIGIKRIHKTSENVIKFGCMPPFGMPLELRTYLDLLDLLDIEYTYLGDEEWCCGMGVVELHDEGRESEAEEFGREVALKTLALSKERGGKNIICFCSHCAHLTKKYLDDQDITVMHYPDILLDHLEKLKLRIKPTTIGYYEGCQLRSNAWAPGVELNWPAYRVMLGRIEGLHVVELPHKVCCSLAPDTVVDKAIENRVDYIVCSCSACHTLLNRAARGKIAVKFLPDLLFESVKESTGN